MFTVSIILPPLVHQDSGLWRKVLPRFQKEAGNLVVEAVKAHIGSADIYTLSDTYARQKPKLRRYKAVAGKPSDQPLILTDALYDAVKWHTSGDQVVIQVEDGKAIAKDGFDYGEAWEDQVQFLELGLRDVEDQLPDLLEKIIMEEMLLGL